MPGDYVEAVSLVEATEPLPSSLEVEPALALLGSLSLESSFVLFNLGLVPSLKPLVKSGGR